MDQLLDLPIADSAKITALRSDDPVGLGLALARAGCSVEAAQLLRPARKQWAGHADAEAGKAALQTMTWWNKHWRDFAQHVQSGRHEAALALLGDRIERLWDQPALLLHLARIAREAKKTGLAKHLLDRLLYLCDRGLPKTDMTVFRYAAEAGLVDVLIEDGEIPEALKAYAALTPNPGNAMGHELQGAGLLAMSGQVEAAMQAVAGILLTANRDRKGWSADMRRAFVNKDPVLDGLRQHRDWAKLVRDPARFLKNEASR